ncbi:MAG: hypothetical protein AAB502_04165 [Chloroflexota bacterium]
MKNWALVLVAVALIALGFVRRAAGIPAPALYQDALVFGAAVVGAAFLLAWASEAARRDFPAPLIVALLAVVVVLPESIVTLHLIAQAGREPAYTAYAAASMSGANRILVGLAVPVVFLAFLARARKGALPLPAAASIDLVFLGSLTLYSFVIYFKSSIALLDSAFLVALFGLYLWLAARAPREQPRREGPLVAMARLGYGWRRAIILGLFLLSTLALVASAGPFVEALAAIGRATGDDLLLVQWFAPLAAQAPKIAVVGVLALRGYGGEALAVLLAARLALGTLLAGALPVALSLSAGASHDLVLDSVQRQEFLLTNAQALFVVFLLASLRLKAWEALVIFVLLVTQLVVSDSQVRLIYSTLYVAGCLGLIVLSRERMRSIVNLIPTATSILQRGGR